MPAGVSGVAVPANTQNPPVNFRWPFRTMLRALIVTVNTGSDADIANLAISMTDENQQLMNLDGQGQQRQTSALDLRGLQQGLGGSVALGGGNFGGRAFAYQRLVQSGDIWVFQLANQGSKDLVPELAFVTAEVTP